MKYSLRKPTTATLTAALFALCALIAVTAAPPRASAAPSAIFGRERLFTLNTADTAALKSSYSTVILFVVDVESNGDLNYNGNHLLVQNGSYVGDPGWGTRLAALKTAPTTVNRIEVCTGGAGAQSFVNIRNLIASQGTGPSSILYRNFQVLKNTLGIDAIDYDDEVDYNAGAAVAFGNLIATLGMRVTLCPYNNQGYWQSVKSQLGSKVDAVYLQCYDGGEGNDPGYWNTLFGGLKVQPGDWDQNSPATVQSNMADWAAADGITGGFIWLFDDMSPAAASQYAAAINNGIDGTNLTAAGEPGSVSLSWTARAGATSYNIYRGTSANGEGTTPVKTNVTTTGYTDTGLTNGVTYYYKVTGVNSGGESGFSNEAFATPQLAATSVVLPTSEQTGNLWQYTLVAPAGNWYTTAFNDSAWQTGLAGFGSINGGGAVSRTSWIATPGDIWIRRHFSISGSVPPSAQFRVFYDEGCEIYINGVQAASTTGYVTSYIAVPMNSAGQAALQVGDNVIAVHCTQTSGGQYIDVGIQAPPVAMPTAPTGLSATASTGQVTLSWQASTGAGSYNVYRATTASGEGATPLKTNVTATNYTDTGLTNGVTYYYKVTAVNFGGESGFSNEALAMPGSAPSSLANGSFETPSVGSASYQYNPTGGTWTFSGNSGIQSNGSAWGAANAPDGTQTAFLQGNPGQGTGALGSISQTVNFSATGNFALTFQAAQRQGQVQPLRFSVDGVQVGGLLTPTSNTFQSYTVNFSVSAAGPHTLTLAATNNSGDNSTLVDQVSVAPVSVSPSLVNGSFETPSVGSASYQYNPTGGAWTFSGNSGIQSNGSAWGAANAPDGTQTAFLQGNPGQGTGALGSISQTVNFSATGNFALTFQAAQRQGQGQPLRFSVDGVQVGGLLTPTSSSFGLLTATFTISSTGPRTLTLAATNNSGDNSTLIDQMNLVPANTLTNGSFETPSVGNASYQYNPTGGAWTFSGNSGIQSNGSIWFAPIAPDGTQTAFLQGNPGQGAGALGSISQTVNFSATGNFALTFQAAQRQGQGQPLRFSVDGVQVGGLLTPTSNSFAPLTSATFTINSPGAHTLTISATNSSGDLSTFVDQFALGQK